MKVKVVTEVDLQTGSYQINFENLSNPGQDIDLARLGRAMNRIFEALLSQMSRPPVLAPTLPPKKTDN